jgi:hypothetical protein
VKFDLIQDYFRDGELPLREDPIEVKDIFLALHTKYTVNVETMQSIEAAGLNSQLHIIRTPFFDKARNDAVTQFLASDCKYILWVDDDNILPTNIMELFRIDGPLLAPVNWGMDKTGGEYKLYPGVSWWTGGAFCVMLAPKSLKLLRDEQGFRYLRGSHGAGGGVWAVRRDVFAIPGVLDEDGEWFKMCWTDKDGQPRRSEDNYFFYNTALAGLHFTVDLTLMAGHLKRVNIYEIAKKLWEV